MTAIVTGQGLGLINTSGGLLGGQGELGKASQGTAGDQVVVDAANGNLVVQHQDEWLVGVGPDVNVTRTYNSQTQSQDSGNANVKNNWRLGYSRMVSVPVNTVINSANSTVTRVAEDGSTTTYTYNGTLYVGQEGFGVADTLAYNATTKQWTWTQGGTNLQETYDGNNNGRLMQVIDPNGHTLTLSYLGSGLIQQIKDDNGETVTIEYDGNNNISDVATAYTDANGQSTTLRRVSYGYDGTASNRLNTVTVNLGTLGTTANGLQLYAGGTSGGTYTTTYNYVGSTTQLASIVQSDNSELDFTYYTSGTYTGRIWTVTDKNSGAQSTYTYAAGSTTVTDGNGNVTKLNYDASGRLTGVVQPAVGSTSAPVTPTTTFQYTSTAGGNVITVTDARGGISTYQYDSNNNLVYQQDASGHVTTRTYSASGSGTLPNLLLTQTVYTSTAAQGATPGSGAQTTRYVYDAVGNLRFEVSPEGRVTNYLYSTVAGQAGLLASKITYSRDFYTTTGTLTLTAMTNWLATSTVDQTQAVRTDYTYNKQGQVQSAMSYQILSGSTGKGYAILAAQVTNYVYDQAGNLLQVIEGKSNTSAGKTTTYAYDGLNRVVWTTDGAGATTQTTYSDSNDQVTVVSQVNPTLSGTPTTLTSVQVFDKSGHLLTVQSTGSVTGNLGTVSHAYDALGHLVQSTDATSQSTYYIYDADGNKVGQISPNGELTEFIYNAAGELTQTIAYATPIAAPTLQSALANGAAKLTLSAVRPSSPNPLDRHTINLYDAAGRLAQTVDAAGCIVTYRYDGKGEMVQKTSYAIGLSSTQLSALQAAVSAGAEVSPTNSNASPTWSVTDRTIHNIYGSDGLLQGSVDGDGYLTAYVYNGSGLLIQTTRYANQVQGTLADNVLPKAYAANATLPTDGSAYVVQDTNNDQNTFYFYNPAAQRTGMVDAQGFFTEYAYDKAGNLTSETRHITPLAGPPITSVLDGTATYPSPVLSASDRVTSYTYDGDNRVLQVSSQPDGQVTNYSYNKQGQLIQTDRGVGSGSANERITQTRYDDGGRATAQLSGAGVVALQALQPIAPATQVSQAQIDAVWKQYQTLYTYDNAGRKLSATDANGNKTLYFYDADGRLTQSVNALGEVTQYDYDAFGDITKQTQYGTRLSSAALTALQGLSSGLNSTSVTVNGTATTPAAVFSALASPSSDSVVSTTYDQRGLATAITQAAAQTAVAAETISRSYNAFGQVNIETQTLDDGSTTTWRHYYDQQGQQLDILEKNGALFRYQDILSYDAFGRVTTVEDSQNYNNRVYTYDRLGRQLTLTDRTGAQQSSTYDAFGRVLTTQDGVGNQTTYAYNDTTRTITVTHAANTAQSFTTTTQNNAYGQVISISDGLGTTTTYGYSPDGILTSTTVKDVNGATLQSTSSALNNANQVVQTKDANGVITSYSYDAANRLMQKVVDPTPSQTDNKTHLNLTTNYLYDAKGQTIWVQDPNGVWTNTTYDLKGEVLTVTVDPASVPSSTNESSFALSSNANNVGLQTTYQYDSHGHTVLVTQGTGASAKVTKYVYDKLGRRIQEIVDPTGLQLTTTYTYDYNDNVVAKSVVRDSGHTDVTRYVYDAEDRLIYSVDPTGAVVQTDYDADGRVTRTTAYATPAANLSSNLQLTAANLTQSGVLQPNSSVDQTTLTIYNSLGQAAYTVDALNHVTQRTYDKNGNVIQVTQYANALSSAPTLVQSGPNNNFVSFTAPALYDPSQSGATVPSTPYVQVNATQDHTTQYVYDGANRLTWTLQTDYAGGANKVYATQNTYDNNGNVLSVTRYANTLSGSFTLGVAPTVVAAAPSTPSGSYILTSPTQDQLTQTVYDAANRVAFVVDPENYVTQNKYDNDGHLTSTTRYYNTLRKALTPGVAPEVVAFAHSPTGNGAWVYQTDPTATYMSDVTTGYQYDNAGRLQTTTDALGNLTKRTYDTAGHVTDVTVSDSAGNNASTTHYVYDAAGRVTDEIKGYRANVASTGPSDYADTRYVLDGVGNRINIIDPRGVELAETDSNWAVSTRQALITANVLDATYTNASATGATKFTALQKAKLLSLYTTTQQFDALGHVTQSTDALGNSTYTSYDAFGNAYKVTDPKGNTGYMLHNQLNQLTWRLDPMGYATRSRYDAFGQVSSIVKYANSVGNYSSFTTAGSDFDAPPIMSYSLYKRLSASSLQGTPYLVTAQSTDVPTPPEVDATTTIVHDLLGRQTKITDAAGNSESMVYDALGNKVSYTNKLNGKYTYGYDRKGNLTTETLPVSVYQYDGSNQPKLDATNTPVAKAVTNTYTYDARGNRIGSVEASTLSEQRTTSYTYDLLNRLVTTTGQSESIYTTAGGSNTVSPTTTNIYDARGNLIEVDTVIDATNTARALTYYDALNRKVADVTPTGTLTTYSYNEGGDLLSKTVYGDSLDMSTVTAGGAAPTIASPSSTRTTNYSYDQDGRQIGTKITGVEIGEINPTTGNYEVRTQDLVTSQTYDANGNVTSQTDARGNTTWLYYDAVGNKTAQVDAERYVTVWQYDAAGNVTNETSYANKLPGSVLLSTTLHDSDIAAAMNRVNWVRQSQTFASPWSASNAGTGAAPAISTITDPSVATAPDGSTGVTRMVFSRGAQTTPPTDDYSVISQSLGDTNEPRGANAVTTASIWVKSNTGTTQYILLRGDGSWDTYKEFAVGPTWTRIQVTTTGAADFQLGIRRGVGTQGAAASATTDILVWGAQREPGSTATDYLPTTTSTNSIASSNDRTTTYLRDTMGRVLSQTIKGVNGNKLDASGNPIADAADATTQYLYDAMGDVTQKSEATGEVLNWSYDQQGRETENQGASFTDYKGNTVRQTTDTEYNGLGLKVRSIERSNGLDTTGATSSFVNDGNVTLAGNTVTKTGGTNTWGDAAVHSSTGYVGGAAVSFSPAQNNAAFMVGLSTSPSKDNNYTSIDWALYCTTGGQLLVYNSGNNVKTIGTYAAGDSLSVAYDGHNIHYFQNGGELYSQQVTITQALYADSSFFSSSSAGGVAASITGLSFAATANRITFMNYGTNGLLTSQTDAVGNTTSFQYDAAGRTTVKSISRQTSKSTTTPPAVVSSSDTNAQTDITTYTYDLAGRQKWQTLYNVNGYSQPLPTSPTAAQTIQNIEVAYDAYGEVVNKSTWGGLTAPTNWQESTTYDKAGRAIISNAGTGVTAGYLFDANGNATLKIESTSGDLATSATIDQILARSDIHLTASKFDKKNQLTDTLTPKIANATDLMSVPPLSSQTTSISIGKITSNSAPATAINEGSIATGAAGNISITLTDADPSLGFYPMSTWTGSVSIPDSAPEYGAGDIVIKVDYNVLPSVSTGQYTSDGYRSNIPVMGPGSTPYATLTRTFYLSSGTLSYSLPQLRTSQPSTAMGPLKDIATPAANWYLNATVTVLKLTPNGSLVLGSASTTSAAVTYVNDGYHAPSYSYPYDLRGTSIKNPTYYNSVSTGAGAKAGNNIIIRDQPPNTSCTVFFYKSQTVSNARWGYATPTQVVGSNGSVPGWFSFDRTILSADKYSFFYVSMDSVGRILNTQTGTMDLTTGAPSITQGISSLGYMTQALQDGSGNISLLNLGANAKTATIQVRLRSGGAAWSTVTAQALTAGALGASNMIGAFNFNPKSAPFNLASGSGPYDYLVTTYDTNGHKLTTAVGSFTVDDANSVSTGAPVLSANLPTTVHFQNLPTAGQYFKLLYRTSAAGSTPAGSWQSGTIANVSPGSYDWDAMTAAPDSTKSYNLDYELQVFDAAGKALSDLSGSVTVGATQSATTPTSNLAGASSAVLVPTAITGSSTAGQTLALYYRPSGATQAFVQASASLITSSLGNDGTTQYTFNAQSLLPSQGSQDYDYYYQLLSGGTPVATTGLPTQLAPAVLHLVSANTTATPSPQTVILGFANHPAQTTDVNVVRDAFGDIVSQTDGDGNTTNFQYNAMGRLTEKDAPSVSSTAENGSHGLITPKTSYIYDNQGRLLATKDLISGFTNSQSWIAEGADGQSHEFTDFYADGGKKTLAYDAFGDLRSMTNLVGSSNIAGSVTTTYLYDADHRLVTQTNPKRSDQTAAASDTYYYDSEGHRIAHTTSDGTSTYTDKTDYDALGRVITVLSAQGVVNNDGSRKTTYTYVWDNTIKGVNGKAIGGWTETTQDSIVKGDLTYLGTSAPSTTPNSLIDSSDIFGHKTSHTDLSGHLFTYTYNAAGWLTDQTSTTGTASQNSGQNIHYDYYADGRVEDIIDKNAQQPTQTLYGYDAAGNKTYEGYATQTNGYWNFYQQSTVSYDALNRITAITDPQNTIKYEYDEAGNRRRVTAFTGASTTATQDLWYTYDKMNRMVYSMATLVDSTNTVVKDTANLKAGDTTHIVLGAQSAGNSAVFLTYDSQGNRASAQYGSDGHTEYYTYTADGYLQNMYAAAYSPTNATANQNNLRASRTLDLLGRVTQYVEYSAANTQKDKQTYAYDADGKVSSSTSEQDNYDNNGGTSTSTTTNSLMRDGTLWQAATHTSNTSGGNTATSDTTTTYQYAWWDSAQQQVITVVQSGNPNQGTSTFGFDANGHVNSVLDSGGGRNLRYTNNAQGLIMERVEVSTSPTPIRSGSTVTNNNTVEKHESYFYFDGQRMGQTGDDPGPSQIDYSHALAAAPITDKKTAYKTIQPITSNYDQNYQPINASYPGFSSTRFVVPSSNTSLQDVARAVWGDSSLWYLIADANGLSASTALTKGQTLVIPNKVTNVHNNSQTHLVYDPSETMGNTSPTLPDPPPPPPADDDSCGGMGVVLMVAVAVVATIATAGAAAVALGAEGGIFSAGMAVMEGTTALSTGAALGAAAIGGAVGSIASQVTGMATGNVQQFSWSAVAEGAVASAVTAGVGNVFNGGTDGALFKGWDVTALKAGMSYAGTVAADSVLGLSSHFSWKNMVSNVAGAVAGDEVFGTSADIGAPGSHSNPSDLAGFGNQFGSNMLSGGIRSAVFNQRPDWGMIAANSFGSALGDSVVGAIASQDNSSGQQESQYVSKPLTQDEINSFLAGTDSPSDTATGSAGALRDRSGQTFSENAQYRASLIAQGIDPDAPVQDAPVVQGIHGQYITVQSGDTVSGLMGSSSPQAVGAFMAGNNMTGSNLRVGQQVFIPDDVNAFGDQSDIGQAVLNADNTRIQQIMQARQQAQSSSDVSPQGGFDFAQALGLPPSTSDTSLVPGFAQGILSRPVVNSTTSTLPGDSIGPWNGVNYGSAAEEGAAKVDAIANAGVYGFPAAVGAYIGSGGNIDASVSAANSMRALDGVAMSISGLGTGRSEGIWPAISADIGNTSSVGELGVAGTSGLRARVLANIEQSRLGNLSSNFDNYATNESLVQEALAANQSPWPLGVSPSVRPMTVGEQFNMVIDANQAQGLRGPGGFGTFDDIPSQQFARDKLAITEQFKSDVSFAQRYEVAQPFDALSGPIGPQIDQVTGRLLPGSQSIFQLDLQLPWNQRTQFLRPVGSPQPLPPQ